MLNQWTPKTTLIVAGVAVVGVWWLSGRAWETARDVGEAVNPVNHDNVFNRGFEGLYQAVTGSDGTPGTDLAEWSDELDEQYYEYTPLGLYGKVKAWWSE
ncbi:hypothetical protein [Marinobacter sp. LN3S78]|uniref:hypothetical protein n=1 Tax=Marinobacter sp. LN3S78 TaxID=3382300 RepID=UPI00387ABF86